MTLVKRFAKHSFTYVQVQYFYVAVIRYPLVYNVAMEIIHQTQRHSRIAKSGIKIEISIARNFMKMELVFVKNF